MVKLFKNPPVVPKHVIDIWQKSWVNYQIFW